MSNAMNMAGLAARPDPHQDPDGETMPPCIAQVLYVIAVLAEYGHHLLETLERRAAARSFATIARYFGTARLSVIIAHIHRGILRAVALDRMLRKRAERGHDLTIQVPRTPGQRSAKPAAGDASRIAPHAEPAPAQPAATRRERRGAPPAPLSLDTLPSMAQLEAEVRRRPVGSSVVAICRDLGVSPLLCEGSFWSRIFTVIYCFRGSFSAIMLEMHRRERRFETQELDHNQNLDWPDDSKDGVRRALGFLIGDPPVDPFRLPEAAGMAASMAAGMAVAAAATGPP